MKITVEQIAPERAEEVLLRCHDPKEPWVEEIQSIAAGQITVNGMADGKLCRLKLGDIYYFEVVDGNAFFYCQKEAFSSKQKLYEFEALCVGTICNELFTWADVYDTANHDERRATLQQFIKEIRVRKDYEISITLNASFNQVEQLKAVSTYDGAEIFEEISEKGA